MKEDFVMRGQTTSATTETINFGGHKDGYGFLLTEFQLYPSNNMGGNPVELMGTITAGKTGVAPTDPNFNDEGLIGTAYFTISSSTIYPASAGSVINDLFVITQDLILMVKDSDGDDPVNWQCKFRPVKLDTAKQALTNYRQFMIFDE